MSAERSSSAPASDSPSAEHFRAVADCTYDWETWVDPNGRVLWINPAVERITGHSVAECLALRDYPLDLVFEADRPGMLDVLARARTGESGNHFEFRIVRKDGAVRWTAISWQPMVSTGGTHLGYRSSVRDIHEKKQLETLLREAMQQAESANRAKSEFLANVSHELRTPLQSILGYAQLLAAADLGEPLHDYAQTLAEQGQKLHQLVSDLLDFSSLQAGVFPLRSEVYAPRDVVEGVLKALRPLAVAKGLELTSRVDPAAPKECEGDTLRLSQVLWNLVGNAVKFTERGGVSVTIEPDARVSGYRLVVEDSGPGLPENQQLFEPFRQGPASALRSPSGVGLGLAICRRLCERMGGALESGRGSMGGARLCAVIPRRALGSSGPHIEHFEPDLASSPVSPAFGAQHPLAILVVDDTAPAREFMQAALRALGYEPAVAESAEAGVALASTTHYGLVLLDIQMPGADGWTAARRLRARLGPSAFLVALTADMLASDAARLADAGFDGFARKPLGVRELQALLRRACERASRMSNTAPVLPSSTFNAERWRELHAIATGPSETLFDRMRRRVLETLPRLLEALSGARNAGDHVEAAKALHDLVGLFSLIGAEPAASLARELEARVGSEDLAAIDWLELAEAAARVRTELESAASDHASTHSIAAAEGRPQDLREG